MEKPRFAPSTRRFAHLVHAPCVYVAELSNGLVKVGASNSARARMLSLSSEVQRVHGAELGRFQIVERPTIKSAFETETNLVLRMGLMAKAVPGHREFFSGVSFERASVAMNDAVRTHRRLSAATVSSRADASSALPATQDTFAGSLLPC